MKIPMHNLNFFSHLSDNSRQNASATHVYIISILNDLEKGKKLNSKCSIWKSTDGFLSIIVVVYRYIFFLYFRLILILQLLEL